MSEEIDYKEKFDALLNIKPANYEDEKITKNVKFNHVGLEIELSVIYTRDRYSFIRTLIKKIKALIGKNGYFVRDNTILGDYSFEIVLMPLTIKKIKQIYSTLLKIIDFSDGSILFDKSKNCGLHMNFNQYDIKDKDTSHKNLLLLMSEKPSYFEENVYKRVYYDFDFKKYIEFQNSVSSKYIAINYLNNRLVEVRNIKVGINSNDIENIMIDIINTLFPDKLIIKRKMKYIKNMNKILSKTFQTSNTSLIKTSLKDELLIIKFTKDGPKIVVANEKIKKAIDEVEI
jgi:hypothetical protein